MKPCVLVVDDDELVCLTIRKWLEHNGYEVITAGDGKSGLKGRILIFFLLVMDARPVFT